VDGYRSPAHAQLCRRREGALGVNALSGPKERKGNGSGTVFGRFWNVAGRPNQTTARGSEMFSSVWRKSPGFGHHSLRLVTNPPTADSPAPNSSDPDAEGSAEESEASSPSQSLQTFPQKGEADGETPAPYPS
jgi:hypothetical protein